MTEITQKPVSNKSESIADVVLSDAVMKEEASIEQLENLSYKEDSRLNKILVKYVYNHFSYYKHCPYTLIIQKIGQKITAIAMYTVPAKLHWQVNRHKYSLDLLAHAVCIIYRSNIGNAKLGGLEEDLNMSKSEYQWSLSIFYFSYVIFDLPSNIIMRRWRPSHWLGILMLYVSRLV